MIEGRDFLDTADYLDTKPTEANRRTQIGRAYYAAFLESRHFCETMLQHVRSRSPREHAEVARTLARVDPQLKVDLAFLRSVRNDADYELDLDPGTIDLQTEQSLRLARSIITRLDERTDTSDDDSRVTPISDDV